MNILILGYGKSSKAVEKYFKKKNAAIDIIFSSEEKEMEKLRRLTPKYDLCFRSPGIKENSEMVMIGRMLSKKLVNELSYATSLINNTRKIIITGSDGKTSLATMLHFLLSFCHRSHLAGNIGTPLFDIISEIKEDDFVVLEASSFQLEDFDSMVEVGILKNLHPNHLDSVFNLSYYYASKLRLKLYADLFLDGRKMKDEFECKNGNIYQKNKIIFSCDKIKHSDESYLENLLLCYCVFQYFHLDFELVLPHLSEIPDVHHRKEILLKKDGMMFVDDGKSSTAMASLYAFNHFPGKKTLILGGIHKSGPFKIPLQNGDKILIYGRDREKIRQELEEGETFETLKEALNTIKKEEGRTILFSPGCSSFDQYSSYIERCDEFRKWVQTWIK